MEAPVKEAADSAEVLLGLFGVSSLAAGCRSALSADRRSLIGFLRAFVLSAFAAVVVFFYIQDYQFSRSRDIAIVCLAAFAGDDLLVVLLRVISKLRDDPMIIIDHIFRRNGK